MDKAIEKKIEAKEDVEEPWFPASLLDVPKELKEEIKSRGLVPKWKRKKDLQRARLEGWSPLEIDEKVRVALGRIIDGTQMGSYLEKPDLILCVIPEKRAVARRKYFEKQAAMGLPDTVQRYEDASVVDGKATAYGSIKIKNESSM